MRSPRCPQATVEGLLKPEKKADLQNILEYHVWVGVLKPEQLTDGKVLNMVNLKNATISRKDGKLMINDATVVASVPTSNGIIHVIDAVIIPPPTITEIVVENGAFSTLETAVVAAGLTASAV